MTDEIARVAPAAAGVTADLTKHARDGVVLPMTAHFAEIVLRTRDLSIMADDGSGTSWDPIKVEGVAVDDAVVTDEGIQAAPDTADAAAATGDVGAEAGESEADAPVAAAETIDPTPAIDAPALHRWDRLAPQPEAPGRDAYALRLVVGRALYDEGRLVSETPLLQRLVAELGLRVHPSDLARIGVDSGGQVKVTSTRGSQVVAVRSDPGVPAGIACMEFSADALGAALLVDAGQPVVDLRVESLR